MLTVLSLFGRYSVSFSLLVEFWCVIERKVLFIKNNKKELVTVKLPICFLIPGLGLAAITFLTWGDISAQPLDDSSSGVTNRIKEILESGKI